MPPMNDVLGHLHAVPAVPAVRVAWVLYPLPVGLRSAAQTHKLLLWEGAAGDLWSDAPRCPSYQEDFLRRNGHLHEGRVLAFHAGVVLVADDQGRLLTLAPENLRVLPPSYPVVG